MGVRRQVVVLCLVCAMLGGQHAKSRVAMLPFSRVADWEQHKAQLRRQILATAGLWPAPPRTPLDPIVTGDTAYAGYRVSTVSLETLPGFRLAGNLYRPTRAGRFPGVLLAHGHWKGGRLHHAEDYSVPALAAGLARQGFVVFAHDMLGYQDSTGLPHSFGHTRAEQLYAFHPLGIQLWNSMRALDYLAAHPAVDPRRLAATGTSGGATQTLLIAAVDDRVRVSAPAGMISATFQGDDACEEAPGLRAGTNNLDFAAMVAPRPQLIVSATGDWTRRASTEALPAIRAIYRLYGAEANLRETAIEGPHNCNRACRLAIAAFFQRHLLPTAQRSEPVDETLAGVDLETFRLPGPTAKNNHERLFADWRAHSHHAWRELPRAEHQLLLRTLAGITGRGTVRAVPAGAELRLRRGDTPGEVRASWTPGAGPGVVLAVSAKGWKHAAELGDPWHQRGFHLLLVEPFGMSASWRAPLRAADHLVYHWSDDARRAADIVTALHYAHDLWPAGRTVLACGAQASAWCLAAAAMVPFPVDWQPERDLTEKEVLEHLFIPGLERAGGVAALRALVEARDVSN